MKLSSLFAPKRMLAVALPALATLITFGLTGLSAAQATDPGFITAKTWIDPANGHAAAGDGVTDDWQNLQDMINYALNTTPGQNHFETVKFEPGKYRITKTLLLALPHFNDQSFGFRMTGIAGPDAGSGHGVCISLDSGSTTQPAVLEVGQGAFVDLTIENLGLASNVSNYGTQYGLLFGEQEFSHVNVHMVTVTNVGTDFAIVAGTTGGGNGEALTLDNCSGGGRCFYSNNCGQALYHRIFNCQGGSPNGGTAFKIGSGNLGFGLDVQSFSYTFDTGPLCNTFVENDGVSGHVNITGGRLEWCNTVLCYGGGSTNEAGFVTIKGMDIYGFTNNFPLLDGTMHGNRIQNNAQWTNKFTDCTFSCDTGGALSLAAVTGDYSRNYFQECVFSNFSNKLNDTSGTSSVYWSSGTTHAPVSNQAALTTMGGIITSCRATAPGNPVLVNMP